MMYLSRNPGCISIVGAIPPTDAHSHHALQLSVALGAAIQLDEVLVRSVLVDADTPHLLNASDCITLLIDAESHWARALRESYLLDATICTNLPITATRASTWAELAMQLVPNVCTGRHLDARIAATLLWFDEMQRENRWLEVSLEGARKRACLSESRFLHVFKDETGIAWRPALAWRRAIVALEYAQAGESLTTAAQMAGYSDSAHLSRQFKATFGLSPSLVLKNSRFIQSP